MRMYGTYCQHNTLKCNWVAPQLSWWVGLEGERIKGKLHFIEFCPLLYFLLSVILMNWVEIFHHDLLLPVNYIFHLFNGYETWLNLHSLESCHRRAKTVKYEQYNPTESIVFKMHFLIAVFRPLCQRLIFTLQSHTLADLMWRQWTLQGTYNPRGWTFGFSLRLLDQDGLGIVHCKNKKIPHVHGNVKLVTFQYISGNITVLKISAYINKGRWRAKMCQTTRK